MTSRPRRIPPTPQQRANRILTQTRGAHSAQGAVPAARPTPTVSRSRPFQQPDGVTTGDSSGAHATSISSTTTGPGPSVATGDGSVAVGTDDGGTGAVASGYLSTAVGGAAFATKTGSVAVGASAASNGLYGVAVGYLAGAAGDTSVAVGEAAAAGGLNGVALGVNTKANFDGSAALGCDSTGVAAEAGNIDEIAIGSVNHIAVIAGKLVIADASAGLWQIVVSTGGALSTVAYP